MITAGTLPWLAGPVVHSQCVSIQATLDLAFACYLHASIELPMNTSRLHILKRRLTMVPTNSE